MKKLLIKIFFCISVLFNLFFIALIVIGSSFKTSNISFRRLDNSYTTAAAVISFPESGAASINMIEISMYPGDTAALQFSVYKNGKQANLLVNALYDREIISVTQTGYGLSVNALYEGSTLMQMLTNEGVKDVALVTVKKRLP